MFDVETFKRLYPEWFEPTTALDILAGIAVFSLLFLIPLVYVKFIEEKLMSAINYRLIPFVRFRLHLDRLINLVDRVLKTKLFRNSNGV